MSELPNPAPTTPHAPTPELADPARSLTHVPALAGRRFGRFAIQRFHASGGLGEVHVAIDEELDRSVALKRLQEQRANEPGARRRFLAEAAITAKLEHPGIVPIYGLVQDDQGQPCYAMRFIAGESLAEAIKRWHDPEQRHSFTGLPFRSLLQRFGSVCQTMAYAHSKHVIHRDLKPANIMLGPFGETLVVDWGLARDLATARATEPSERSVEDALPPTVNFTPTSAEERVYTQAGQALGTPGYMSPEQAVGRWDAVDIGSDIYSLGATLYQLLTGHRPINAASWPEMQQKTQRGDFPAPRNVRADAPKPLEAICLKALALEPEKRYASAKALADDIEHWLADEPVSAFVEPWPVRSGRWMRRHRTLVTGLAAALMVGLVTVIAALVTVEAAYSREQLAKNEALTAKGRAEEQRQRAEEARQKTHQAFDDLTNEKALAYLRTQPELRPEQREFLERAAAYYREVSAQLGDDEASRHRIANSNYRLAYLLQCLGRAAEAEAPYRSALAIHEKLVANFPAQSQYKLDRANNQHNLGKLLSDLGQKQAAEQAYRRAQESYQQLVDAAPQLPVFRKDLANSHNSLGLLLEELGQHPKAEQEHRQALAIQEKLAADFPAEAAFRLDVARTHRNLGLVNLAVGQRQAAEKAFRQALEITAKLTDEYPEIADYRHEQAENHNALGALFHSVGDRAEAAQCFRLALELKEKIAADFPTVAEYRQDLAEGHNNLGAVLRELGQTAQAEQSMRHALALFERLATDFPRTTIYRQRVAGTAGNLGVVLMESKQEAAAEQAFRRAMEAQQKLAADAPNVLQYRIDLAMSYVNFGHFLRERHQATPSLEWYSKGMALLEPMVQQSPQLVAARLFLRNAHMGRAEAMDELGRHADALKDWDQAMTLNPVAVHTPIIRLGRARTLARAGDHAKAVAEANALAELDGATSETFYDLCCICAIAAAAVKDDAKLQDQYAARAVELLRRAVAKGYKDVGHLKKDDDFNALREREDFKKLVKDLQEKK